MPSQVTNYKCPSCTGPLHYDSKSGQMACEYCGSVFTVQQIEALYEGKNEQAENAFNAAQAAQAATAENAADVQDGMDVDWDLSAAGSDWGAEGEGLRAYICPSCGAELICDETTAATSCPYCNNPSIVPGQLSDMLKPDYVIPFKLDKDAAMRALKNYYRGKTLLPRAFSDNNHIEEIKGVYVPFWLFDGKADADMSYQGTRVHTATSGEEVITTTDYFRIRRSGTVSFDKIPVDASSKMPDAHMDAIEPYDYSELRPFSNAYLPGYFADKYDVSPEDCKRHADERAENTTAEIMDRTVSGYSSCIPERRQVRIRRGRVSYALLPVWLLATKWNGKNYLFAMNGQTGKLIGDLPVSRGKALAWFAGIALPLMALMTGLLY